MRKIALIIGLLILSAIVFNANVNAQEKKWEFGTLPDYNQTYGLKLSNIVLIVSIGKYSLSGNVSKNKAEDRGIEKINYIISFFDKDHKKVYTTRLEYNYEKGKTIIIEKAIPDLTKEKLDVIKFAYLDKE